MIRQVDKKKYFNEIINFTARQDDSIQIKLYECMPKPFDRCINSVKKTLHSSGQGAI